jgi:hypothetical protein
MTKKATVIPACPKRESRLRIVSAMGKRQAYIWIPDYNIRE